VFKIIFWYFDCAENITEFDHKIWQAFGRQGKSFVSLFQAKTFRYFWRKYSDVQRNIYIFLEDIFR